MGPKLLRTIVFNFMRDSPVAKKYPRMTHDDWASYIGIFTSDGKKRLAEKRKRRQKARNERLERRGARAFSINQAAGDQQQQLNSYNALTGAK